MSASSSVNSMSARAPSQNSSKSIKKHSMFLNALSWKKFSSGGGSSGDSCKKQKGHHQLVPAQGPQRALFARSQTADNNIHPMIDSNKNIQSALCHGAKSTLLNEKHLDLVPAAAAAGQHAASAVVTASDLINKPPSTNAASSSHDSENAQPVVAVHQHYNKSSRKSDFGKHYYQ